MCASQSPDRHGSTSTSGVNWSGGIRLPPGDMCSDSPVYRIDFPDDGRENHFSVCEQETTSPFTELADFLDD